MKNQVPMECFTPDVWDRAMEEVKGTIGEKAYEAWLSNATLDDFEGDRSILTISLPNDFYRRWVMKRYNHAIQDAFTRQLGADITVELVSHAPEIRNREPREQEEADPDLFQETLPNRQPSQNGNGTGLRPSPSRPASEEPRISAAPPRINHRYVFDEFVVGESNRFAYSSAQAVSDPKSKAFNPLFIYGGSGLGKTHLMQAIGNQMYKNDESSKVVYLTSEYFINSFIDAIQNKRLAEFRARYRNADLLLVDDVQFLMGKERTQQEFFHTFNALYDAGKKVVVSSDRPPKNLETLEDRLRSRFEWGLMVDIQVPDLETRMAILRKKASQENFILPNDVNLFIAENVTDTVRELEGALKRLKMAATMNDRPIDLESAREVLGYLMVGREKPAIDVSCIQRIVARHFNITVEELRSKNRSKKYSRPRHICQYLCRKITGDSYPDIATHFGGQDHTSVIYAYRKIAKEIEKNNELGGMVDALSRKITKGEAG